MKTLGRILLYVAIAIIALPFVYVVGVYAIIFGAYAIVALGSLMVAPFTMFPSTWDDAGAYAIIAIMALLALALSVGGLYLIWFGVRYFIASIRNRRMAAGTDGH